MLCSYDMYSHVPSGHIVVSPPLSVACHSMPCTTNDIPSSPSTLSEAGSESKSDDESSNVRSRTIESVGDRNGSWNSLAAAVAFLTARISCSYQRREVNHGRAFAMGKCWMLDIHLNLGFMFSTR